MADTLSTIRQQVYFELGQTEEFLATGTPTTTAVRNSFWGDLDNPPEESKFKNSYLAIAWDAAGASAAPEGEWGRITAFNTTDWELTISAVTSAVGAGDRCMFVSTKVFPLFEMDRAINTGLKKLGYLRKEDTSLTTANNQTEYTIPATLRGRPLWGVWVEGNDDANDNQWIPINGYEVLDSTTLYIPQYLSGYTIKLGGWALHDDLTAYNSALSVYVPKPLAVAAGGAELLKAYIGKNADDTEKSWRAMFDQFTQEREMQMARLDIWRPEPHRNRLEWGKTMNDKSQDSIIQAV